MTKYFILLLVFSAMLNGRATAQSTAGSIPAADIQRSDVKECGGVATMTLDEAYTTAECLEQNGHYVTAYTLLNIVFARIESPDQLETISDATDRLKHENFQHPQLPDVQNLASESCEAQALAVIERKGYASDWIREPTDIDDLNERAAEALSQDPQPLVSCLFHRKDWSSAIRILKAIDDSAIMDMGRPYYEWLLAIAFEKVGDRNQAKEHISNAYNDLTGLEDEVSGTLLKQIKYDYNRLGAAKDNARKLAAELQRDDQQIRQQARTVCHVEEYDGADYHEVTYWYCVAGEYVRAETYINGQHYSTFYP
jgi:hypothetical protein